MRFCFYERLQDVRAGAGMPSHIFHKKPKDIHCPIKSFADPF